MNLNKISVEKRKDIGGSVEGDALSTSGRAECCRYFPWEAAAGVDEVRERLEHWISLYRDSCYFQWAITLKETGRLIGIINLHNVDTADQSAETSYILNPDFWGQGLMTVALEQVISFGFGTAGLKRIYADCFDGNHASIRVLKKCGLIYEGTAKGKYHKNGLYADAHEYAIQKQE